MHKMVRTDCRNLTLKIDNDKVNSTKEIKRTCCYQHSGKILSVYPFLLLRFCLNQKLKQEGHDGPGSLTRVA